MKLAYLDLTKSRTTALVVYQRDGSGSRRRYGRLRGREPHSISKHSRRNLPTPRSAGRPPRRANGLPIARRNPSSARPTRSSTRLPSRRAVTAGGKQTYYWTISAVSLGAGEAHADHTPPALRLVISGRS